MKITPLIAKHHTIQDEQLAAIYNKICGNEIPFLSPSILDGIMKDIPALADKIIGVLGHETSTSVWGLTLIENMLEKGYNPAALSSTVSSAELCLESLRSMLIGEENLTILELGVGAGWSTLILYNLLLNHFPCFTFHAADVSPYSISCAAKMLTCFEIPYQIISRDKVIEESSGDSKLPRVTLHVQDFNTICRCQKNNSIHAVYSNHGTAYLKSEKHNELVSNINIVLKPGGVFITDSLDPQVIINLSKFFVISSVLLGNNQKRFSRYSEGNYYKYQDLDNGVRTLRIMRDKSSANFLDWLHYLLFSGNADIFKKYLSALKRSVLSQQTIREWVAIPSKSLIIPANDARFAGWESISLPSITEGPYTQTAKFEKCRS